MKPHTSDNDELKEFLEHSIPEKTHDVNLRRHDRKHKQADRDIRRLAAALIELQTNGSIPPRMLEALVEMMRRN